MSQNQFYKLANNFADYANVQTDFKFYKDTIVKVILRGIDPINPNAICVKIVEDCYPFFKDENFSTDCKRIVFPKNK